MAGLPCGRGRGRLARVTGPGTHEHSPPPPGNAITPTMRRLAVAHWPLALVCAVFLLIGARVVDDYAVSWDGPKHREIGNAALDSLAGDGERALDQLSHFHDRYYGAVFEAPLALVERGLGDERDIWLSRHLLTHLFFLTGGVFCYLLALRLFGSRALALIAMALFLLHPLLYAHSFFNSKDVPFLVMFMVSLYLVHRAFRRNTLGAFLLCGVGVGVLINLRVMGVVLFAAVLALRALDLLAAPGPGGRKRILLTGGAFALATLLTYYTSLPALWTDPAGQSVELVQALANHQNPQGNLFRGEWLPSADGPPWDYVPVWVGITTPPATLLLAFTGAVALAWGGLRRPRDILRDAPLRFGLLLIALPVVTVVVVVVLGNNIYHGWRHLYFLYAPLCLLAVAGLQQLVAARGRWPRAIAYALAAAAIAVAAVSLVRIHPHQNNYFNFLVDRTTPERLNSSWTMNFWRMAGQHLVHDIVRDHPSGNLFLSLDSLPRYRAILPADDREQIVETLDFRSGERNFYDLRIKGCSAPVPPAPISHVSRIYATTLSCMIDPVAYFGGFRQAALASGSPLVRSTWHIHRNGSTLTYLRDGCPRAEDAGRRFFLHVQPVDASDLPPGATFDNRDFPFGARIDGNCIAVARLPDYPIASIHTGLFSDAGIHWEVEFTSNGRIITPSPSDLARAWREALASEPLARAVYDVYREGRALTYVREGCSVEEGVARFFLHVEPVDAADLPAHRREHGFDNLDFTLGRSGGRVDGSCVAVARLPDYPIASVRTGQYDDTGQLWAVEFVIPDEE